MTFRRTLVIASLFGVALACRSADRMPLPSLLEREAQQALALPAITCAPVPGGMIKDLNLRETCDGEVGDTSFTVGRASDTSIVVVIRNWKVAPRSVEEQAPVELTARFGEPRRSCPLPAGRLWYWQERETLVEFMRHTDGQTRLAYGRGTVPTDCAFSNKVEQ